MISWWKGDWLFIKIIEYANDVEINYAKEETNKKKTDNKAESGL